MRLVGTLMAASFMVLGCSGTGPTVLNQPQTGDPPPLVTTSTTQPVATVPPTSQVSSSTVVLTAMAPPSRLISVGLGVDVVVSTESQTPGIIDPPSGEVTWVPIGDTDPGPGEPGLVLIAGHLNVGEPFYNLIDDSDRDRRNGVGDHGLSVGEAIDFLLTDATICRYRVIDPLGVGLDNVEQVPHQPAIYFPKTSEIMNPILTELITEAGDRPIVMMWVSYAGPDNDQWRPNGTNRLNNAVVFSELDTCNPPTP